ncbi:MAG: hypothetical protein IJJ61_05050 [Clostridia bacterium]|nr:hypothetical protein [Clostridia bacterium]MBR6335902.1 hypothetical protein [Clostridia bacterium]
MKKLFCIVLAFMFAALCFSACGKNNPETTTAAPDAVVEEDGQNPIMNFIGNYQSDRRTMLVEAVGMDKARVSVHWGSSAWEAAEWEMEGIFEETDDALVMNYTGGTYAVVTTDEAGNETRSDEKADCAGTVLFKKADNTVVWTAEGEENIKDLVFEYVPVA